MNHKLNIKSDKISDSALFGSTIGSITCGSLALIYAANALANTDINSIFHPSHIVITLAGIISGGFIGGACGALIGTKS